MKRLFLAIKISPNAKMIDTYNSIRKALEYNKISWIDPDKFHITLKFFGDTSEESISIVNRVIIDSIESFSSFDIEFKKTGVFGSSYKPRVIWFGITENEQLQKLVKKLLNNLDEVGFRSDRQNFVPHLTIGRISRIVDKKLFNQEINRVKDVFLQKTTVDSIILYESILSTKEPIYNVINIYNFN